MNSQTQLASNGILSSVVNAPLRVLPTKKERDAHLVWVDMEMSGLSPQTDRVLEIAIVVTNSNLDVIATAPVLVLHQSDELLAGMDSWNQGTHKRSGLIDKVKASTLSETDAEAQLLEFLREWSAPAASPMCGNTVCQDRRFMANYLPKLEAFFHYRNIDVSTLKELCRRWRPDLKGGFAKQQAHTALADILESVAELRYYREHFLHAAPALESSLDANKRTEKSAENQLDPRPE